MKEPLHKREYLNDLYTDGNVFNFINYWENAAPGAPTHPPEWLKLRRYLLSSVLDLVWEMEAIFTMDDCTN